MIEAEHERRNNPRFDCSLPVSFRILRGDSEKAAARFTEAVGVGIRGIVGNVSIDGLYLEANLRKDQVGDFAMMNKSPDKFFIEIEI